MFELTENAINKFTLIFMHIYDILTAEGGADIRLTFPAAERIAHFHHLVVAHAGRTQSFKKKTPYDGCFLHIRRENAHSVKGREWSAKKFSSLYFCEPGLTDG